MTAIARGGCLLPPTSTFLGGLGVSSRCPRVIERLWNPWISAWREPSIEAGRPSSRLNPTLTQVKPAAFAERREPVYRVARALAGNPRYRIECSICDWRSA